MKITDYKDFAACLKSGCHLFLLYGDNDFYKRKAYQEIILSTVGKDPSDFSLLRFDDQNMDVEAIHNGCITAPFLCEKKCVCVVDLPFAQLSEKDAQLLSDTIEDLPEFTTLIFYCISDDFDIKKPKTKKIADKISKFGCEAFLSNKTQKNGTQGFVLQRVKDLGCTISRPNASRIAEKANGDFEIMDHEIEKLCAYKPGGEIESDDIDALFSLYLASTVFELTKCIFSGDYEGAFQRLNRLKMQKEEPIAVLGELSAAFLDYYRALVGRNAGKTADDIKNDFGYRSTMGFRVDNAYRAAYQYRDLYLQKCILMIKQADLELKSGSTDKYLVLEQLITQIFLAKEVKRS